MIIFEFLLSTSLFSLIFYFWYLDFQTYNNWNILALGQFSQCTHFVIPKLTYSLGFLFLFLYRSGFYKSIFCSFTSTILIYIWLFPLAFLSSFLNTLNQNCFTVSLLTIFLVLEIANNKKNSNSLSFLIPQKYLTIASFIVFFYSILFLQSSYNQTSITINDFWESRELLASKLPPGIYFLNNLIFLGLVPFLNIYISYNNKFYLYILNCLSALSMMIATSHRGYFILALLSFFLMFGITSKKNLIFHLKKIFVLYLLLVNLLLAIYKILENKNLFDEFPKLQTAFLTITGIGVWRNLFAYPFTYISQMEFLYAKELKNISEATQLSYYLVYQKDGWLAANFIPEALLKGGFLRLSIIAIFLGFAFRVLLDARTKLIYSYNFLVCSLFFLFISIASYFFSALLSNGFAFLLFISSILIAFEKISYKFK